MAFSSAPTGEREEAGCPPTHHNPNTSFSFSRSLAAGVAVSFPNYLFGEDSLYSDINLYKDYGFDHKKKEAPELLTAASVKEDKENYLVTIDIEPSTGKAMQGHNR